MASGHYDDLTDEVPHGHNKIWRPPIISSLSVTSQMLWPLTTTIDSLIAVVASGHNKQWLLVGPITFLWPVKCCGL